MRSQALRLLHANSRLLKNSLLASSHEVLDRVSRSDTVTTGLWWRGKLDSKAVRVEISRLTEYGRRVPSEGTWYPQWIRTVNSSSLDSQVSPLSMLVMFCKAATVASAQQQVTASVAVRLLRAKQRQGITPWSEREATRCRDAGLGFL